MCFISLKSCIILKHTCARLVSDDLHQVHELELKWYGRLRGKSTETLVELIWSWTDPEASKPPSGWEYWSWTEHHFSHWGSAQCFCSVLLLVNWISSYICIIHCLYFTLQYLCNTIMCMFVKQYCAVMRIEIRIGLSCECELFVLCSILLAGLSLYKSLLGCIKLQQVQWQYIGF